MGRAACAGAAGLWCQRLLFSPRCWVPRALPGALVAVAKGGQVLLHLPSQVQQVMDMPPLNNSQQPALLEGLEQACKESIRFKF